MMARAVIRKPEIPCFVLNSQVRVADWGQVCGTHQMGWLLPSLDGIAMCQISGVTATETKGRQP
jgi:hypothetical protein